MAERPRLRARGEGGFSAVETVLMIPVLIMFVELVFFCGRASVARQEVYGAARDAARAASATDIDNAAAAATQSADLTLSTHQAACATPIVTTDLSRFHAGGVVTVTVTCHIAVSDLDLLHAPGSTTVQTSFPAPIDPLRGGG